MRHFLLKYRVSTIDYRLNNMTINEIQDEIIGEFAFFDDWMDKYEYIIELGKDLPLIDEQYKTEDHLIKGCQSLVWLHADDKDGKVQFTADSDAIITKGLIALMIRVLSDQKPENIAAAELYFIDKIGLQEHLSPTRANGLLSMVKQMKMYGLALQARN
jgi:cysteine desulfuration protein SufE